MRNITIYNKTEIETKNLPKCFSSNTHHHLVSTMKLETVQIENTYENLF